MTTPADNQRSAASAHLLLWPLLLVLLWAFQVRYPPLSYPAFGTITVVGLAGFVLFGIARVFRNRDAATVPPPLLARHPAFLPGFLFVAWVCVRWIMAGAPADATADVTLPLWSAAWFLTAVLLHNPPKSSGDNAAAPVSPLSFLFLETLCLAGLVCGAYAIFQYHIFYQDAYQDLVEIIGNRTPDRTEAALLHHLNLRRVASFWGDPNSYAAFAALAVAASVEVLLSAQTLRRLWQTIAAMSILASLGGIFYTGSRGGVLDVCLVAAWFGVIFLARRRLPLRITATAAMLFCLLILPTHNHTVTAQASSSPTLSTDSAAAPAAESGWIWRSDTIRERLYYLQVGARMIALAPVTGLGPGSVNDYFGRLKSPNAREARHLHNWFANTWAELGAIGIALLCWILGAVAWRAWTTRLFLHPVHRTHVLLFGVLLFDGLLQTSWDQRELMSTLGLITGCIVAATSTPAAVSKLALKLWIRVAAAFTIAAALLALELPFLSATNAKQIANDAIIAGDPRTALRYYEKAQRWAPRDPEPYQARAQLALKSGQLSAARMLYQRALQVSPESAALNSQIAELHLRLQDPQAAERHLQRALQLYPSHPGYNLQYARFLQSQGRPNEARRYGDKAAEYSYLPEQTEEIREFLRQLR